MRAGRYFVLGCSGLLVASAIAASTAQRTAATHRTPVSAVHPMLQVASTRFAAPPTTADCEATIGLRCYSPRQLRVAYHMPALYRRGLTGRGRTIAIVDSFGSPTIAADLAGFDRAFGLPAPPRFAVLQPEGAVPPFDPNDPQMVTWALESTLDVEYAHAMAPDANILLVETPVAETQGLVGLPQIVAAENYVIDHGLADVISQSFGATEQTFPSHQSIRDLRSAFINAAAHDVTVLASSGDAGATNWANAAGTRLYPHRVIAWPSSDPLVTSVGGTQLHLDPDGHRLATDNVWNDTNELGSPLASGGGRSVVFARPSYQAGVSALVGTRRGTPDLSLTAALDGGALVYGSFLPGGATFFLVGGTSESTPLFAGIVAIADQAAHRDLGLLNPTLYSLADGGAAAFIDVDRGNNTVTFVQNGRTVTVPGFAATAGYDLASGLGTVDGDLLVRELRMAAA